MVLILEVGRELEECDLAVVVLCERFEFKPEVVAVTPAITKLLPQPKEASVIALYPTCTQLSFLNPARFEKEKKDVVKLITPQNAVIHPDAPFLDTATAVEAAEITADVALMAKLIISFPGGAIIAPTAPAPNASNPSTKPKSCPVAFALIHDVARLIAPPITAAAA